jgi:hypothetical protein
MSSAAQNVGAEGTPTRKESHVDVCLTQEVNSDRLSTGSNGGGSSTRAFRRWRSKTST